jgi:hypothetical protein
LTCQQFGVWDIRRQPRQFTESTRLEQTWTRLSQLFCYAPYGTAVESAVPAALLQSLSPYIDFTLSVRTYISHELDPSHTVAAMIILGDVEDHAVHLLRLLILALIFPPWSLAPSPT